MNRPFVLSVTVALLCILSAFAQPASAQVRIGDICRVKGQDEQKLIGFGLVFGLDGTGDPDKFLPTAYATSMAMKMLGADVTAMGEGIEALKGSRNAAVVYVEVTLPPAGLSKGDQVDCRVTAAGATKKSLKGARLLPTPLIAPIPGEDPNNPGVYAYASGPVSLDEDNPLSGTIARGCTMGTNMITPMSEMGRVTLLVDPKHTSWGISKTIADEINSTIGAGSLQAYGPSPGYTRSRQQKFAQALNQRTIEIMIPEFYDSVPDFIADIMRTPISEVPNAARVVVDERSGTIVIDPNVEIEAGVFSVNGISVEVAPPGGNFVPFDPQPADNFDAIHTAKLQALVDALNAIKVPSEQVVSIIRALEAGGKIHGHVEYIR
ncbi:MAG: flagellar basal body P-ring protein FlgI [Pirellulales bacterium]|nr:flagellar basal body P-ring protein FlgI [Pirellulales bacterium]